jgi:hypothetical protein
MYSGGSLDLWYALPLLPCLSPFSRFIILAGALSQRICAQGMLSMGVRGMQAAAATSSILSNRHEFALSAPSLSSASFPHSLSSFRLAHFDADMVEWKFVPDYRKVKFILLL